MRSMEKGDYTERDPMTFKEKVTYYQGKKVVIEDSG